MPSRRLILPLPTASDDVTDFVEQLATAAGLARDRAYWLLLAADEITTNVAEHAYGGGRGVLDLVGEMDEQQVRIEILDDGPAFDPRGHDTGERLSQPPAEREAGGMGLLLALGRLDGFDYRRADGRNCNVLVMARPGRTGAPAGTGDEQQ